MFNKQHISSLIGYLGIGFISGSISHGFFSGTRSIIMALIGIILFLISEYASGTEKNYKDLILFGLIYSISVGMVSGGLQHFQDSPWRSLWILPVGFFVSLLIFPLKYGHKNIKRLKSLLVGGLISIFLFVITYSAIKFLPDSFFSSSDNHNSLDLESAEHLD